MSNISVEQSPKSSKCAGVSGIHPISNIIQSLRTSLLDTDYEAVVRELMEREDGLRKEKEDIVFGLREKSNNLEAEVMSLKLENYRLEAERGRLRRELGVNDDKLKKLETELRLVKGNEEKRCDRLRDNIRELEEEQDKFISCLSHLSDRVDEVNAKLEVKEEEMDELVREKDAQLNQCKELEEEKLKLIARLEKFKRENKEMMEEVLKRNKVVEARQEELEGLRKVNVSLEKKKKESDACIEGLRKSNDEKDERMKKLVKEIEVLEREKRDTVKDKDEQIKKLKKEKEDLGVEKRELAVKLGLVEERFLKLEREAITCLCLDLEKDKAFSSTYVGKILSGIIKAFDSEEAGLTCNAGLVNDENHQEADSAFVSHVNEPKLKSDLESLEAVERTLDFEAEFSRDRAIGNKKTTFVDPIIIDSDDDDENLLHVNSIRNKRQCSGSSSKQHNHDGSSDDSLILVRKTKKLKHVPCEQVKQEASLAALSTTRSDQLFNNSRRPTLPTLKKCEEKPWREDNGTPKADKRLNPKAAELMTTHWQKKQDKKLEYAADIICAFEEDEDFCAKAVCALYRLQKSGLSGTNGSTCLRNKGFEECDMKRGTALAEFLIDGDPKGKMKMSVNELQEHDREDCRKLAKKYSKQLINIYKRREDPLFSPLSADLPYK